MNARYYLPGLARFASPDTLIPDPTNPQALNRYTYSYNNPLRFIDPSGHCPAPPADMGAAICMALFIQPSMIAAGPLMVHGDNRDFSNTSSPASSRGFIWIPVAEAENFHTQMNPSGYLFPIHLLVSTTSLGPISLVPVEIEQMVYFPPSHQNMWEVKQEANGIIRVSYDLVISGPLEWTGNSATYQWDRALYA